MKPNRIQSNLLICIDKGGDFTASHVENFEDDMSHSFYAIPNQEEAIDYMNYSTESKKLSYFLFLVGFGFKLFVYP